MPNEKTISAEERIARAACDALFSEPADQALINSCSEAIAAELEAYAAEKVREVVRFNDELTATSRDIERKVVRRMISEAVAEEREACAKVAEEFKMHGMNCSLILWTDEQCSCEAGPISDAIRSQGKK